MKTRLFALVAVLWSFIPGIAFATPPAAQPIDTDWFYPNWVLHEPGSSTITVYGTSDRVGTTGARDFARLKATDNGVSNSYSFAWMGGINTVAQESSMLVCPSGSFCAGKAIVLKSGAIAKCDISGDSLSGCSNIPSFVASESIGLTTSKIIAQKSSNNQLYLVDPTTGASTPMSSTCSPPTKMSMPAGGLAGGFLYLSSDRAGALTDPGDGLAYYDIFRIAWNGSDCTGSATNINNAGTGYAAINTGPGLEIGAVDPLTGSIFYRDWNTDHPFVAKKEKDCGDGFIEEGEQCDPNAKDVYGSPPDDSKWQLNAATCLSIPGGFTGGTLKCNPVTCMYDTSSCTAPASCGDGVKNGTDSCDGLDLGSASCTSIPGGFSGGTLACSGSCTFNTSGCYKCGDGTINPGEVCDGASFGGATCSSIKGPGWTGSLTCSACAAIDSSACVPPSAVCGDGNKNGSESCDGSDLGSASCTSIPGGFSGGTLACSGSCTFNTSGCYKCGDGTINPGEVCDGASFGGATCSSIKGPGWTGSLTCSACTSILSSACVPPAPVCGNGIKEAGEECDPPDVGSCSVLGEGYTGTPSCNGACKLVYDGCTAPETCGNGSLDAGEQCDGSVPAGKTCESELGKGWTGSLSCGSCILNKSGCSFDWGIKNLSGACSKSGTGKDQQIGFTGGSCSADYWPIGALTPTKLKWTAVAGKALAISVVNAGEPTKVNVPYGVDHDEVIDNGNKYELGGGGESLGVGGTIYSQKWLNPETWRSTCTEGYITFSATETGAPASGLNLDGTPGKLPSGYGVDINITTNTTSTSPWLLSGSGGTGGDGGSGGDAGSAGDGGAGSAGEAGNGGAGEAGHGGSGGSGVGGEAPNVNSDAGDGGTCSFNPTSKGPNGSFLLIFVAMLTRLVSRRRNRE